jgi:2-polyprenyl-3-methyl-5-hydroxy-6-metoxy-1,4-benzoquinol methylase
MLTMMSMRVWLNILSINDLWVKGMPITSLDDKPIHPLYHVWSPFNQDYLGLLDEYIQSEPVSGFAVDVGCGTGVLGLILAKHGCDVTCTDIDRAAV